MDLILKNWQEVLSLAIVLFTAVLMAMKFFAKRKVKEDCAHCALVQPQQNSKQDRTKK